MIAPYFSDDTVTIYCGDCREVMPQLGVCADAIVTDPPYGDTSLAWDTLVPGWLAVARAALKPSGSAWVFGSMRHLLGIRDELRAWSLAQDVVWEKHNGSNSAADRFRRVHELALHLYPADVAWADVYHAPVTTLDAVKRQVRRKQRPPQWGEIGSHSYTSEDGGPRLQRSVIYARSCHGYAVHPTQKPTAVLRPLIEHSVPRGGVVLDPFGGSGSTAEAARELGRRAVLIEVDERWCAEMVRRLAQAPLALGVA